jgi:hypothetical protein
MPFIFGRRYRRIVAACLAILFLLGGPVLAAPQQSDAKSAIPPQGYVFKGGADDNALAEIYHYLTQMNAADLAATLKLFRVRQLINNGHDAGSISEIVLRYVLRAKLGLQPDRDVKLLVVGDPAVGLQALERGIVDATPLTMPLPLMAAKMGFRELVNYDALGITFPANTVTTSRQTIGKRPELIDSFLRILIEGIYVFKSNKPKSLAIMKKNLLGASDEVLEETYRYTTAVLEQQPYPSLDVIRSGLEILSLQYPQAKQTDPNPLVDASFVKRIDQSGFIAALYKN